MAVVSGSVTSDLDLVRPPADRFMCRLLGLSAEAPAGRPTVEKQAEVHRAFSQSILVSAVRCVLTYLVLPFLAPAIGFAKGVGPWIGLPLGLVAIAFNIKSMRRFWAANHKYRWAYTFVGGSVIALLLVLMAGDLAELLT